MKRGILITIIFLSLVFVFLLMQFVSALTCTPGPFNTTHFCNIAGETELLKVDYEECLNDYGCLHGSCVYGKRTKCELTDSTARDSVDCTLPERGIPGISDEQMCGGTPGCTWGGICTGTLDYMHCEELYWTETACKEAPECEPDYISSRGRTVYDTCEVISTSCSIWNDNQTICESIPTYGDETGCTWQGICITGQCSDWDKDQISCRDALGCSWSMDAVESHYCEPEYKEIAAQTNILQNFWIKIVLFFSGTFADIFDFFISVPTDYKILRIDDLAASYDATQDAVVLTWGEVSAVPIITGSVIQETGAVITGQFIGSEGITGRVSEGVCVGEAEYGIDCYEFETEWKGCPTGCEDDAPDICHKSDSYSCEDDDEDDVKAYDCVKRTCEDFTEAECGATFGCSWEDCDGNWKPGEECDGGNNCQVDCTCPDGYVSDEAGGCELSAEPITNQVLKITFNDGTATDSSEKKNDGTFKYGAAVVDIDERKAVYFRSDYSDYVRVSDNVFLDMGKNEDFSLEVVFKSPPITTDTTDTRVLIDKRKDWWSYKGYALHITADGKVQSIVDCGTRLNCPSSDYTEIWLTSNTGSLDDNQWHHVVATFDRNDRIFSLYVDGELDKSIDSSGWNSMSIANGVDLRIGEGKKGFSFWGYIDEVRIYKHKVLSADDVKSQCIRFGVCEEEKPECIPETCSGLGYECGTWDDGCEGTLYCGDCPLEKPICSDGVCVADENYVCTGTIDSCDTFSTDCPINIGCVASTSCDGSEYIHEVCASLRESPESNCIENFKYNGDSPCIYDSDEDVCVLNTALGFDMYDKVDCSYPSPNLCGSHYIYSYVTFSSCSLSYSCAGLGNYDCHQFDDDQVSCLEFKNYGCEWTDTVERDDLCGNNIIDNGEECDDGNDINDDGCSYPTCQIEPGYVCTKGEPSYCRSATITPGENLLENPGFEDGDTGFWIPAGIQPGTEISQTEEGEERTGDWSARLKAYADSTAWWSKKIPITISEDTTFNLSGWYFMEQGHSVELFLLMYTEKTPDTDHYPSGWSFDKTSESFTEGRWIYLSKLITVNANTVELAVRLDNNGKGTYDYAHVSFDDINLVMVEEESTIDNCIGTLDYHRCEELYDLQIPCEEATECAWMAGDCYVISTSCSYWNDNEIACKSIVDEPNDPTFFGCTWQRGEAVDKYIIYRSPVSAMDLLGKAFPSKDIGYKKIDEGTPEDDGDDVTCSTNGCEFTDDNLPDRGGTYYYIVESVLEKDFNYSNEASVSVGRVALTIEFTDPTTGLIVTAQPSVGQKYIEANVTANDDVEIDTITIELSNSTDTFVVRSQAPAGSISFHSFTNFTALAYGEYELKAIVNNTLGGEAFTEIRTISLYSTPVSPSVSIIYPISRTYNTPVTELNYSVLGTTLDSCWYSLDRGLSNSTPVIWPCVNFTGLQSSEGENTWTVYVNNTDGEEASDSVTFTYSPGAMPPIVKIYPLEKNTYYAGEIIEFTANITDEDAEIDNWNLSSDIIGEIITGESFGEVEFEISVLDDGLVQGDHTITLEAEDTDGFKSSDSFDITIENENCTDGKDNDRDGIIDGLDKDCAAVDPIKIEDVFALGEVYTHRKMRVDCEYSTDSPYSVDACIRLNLSGRELVCDSLNVDESSKTVEFEGCNVGSQAEENAELLCYVSNECNAVEGQREKTREINITKFSICKHGDVGEGNLTLELIKPSKGDDDFDIGEKIIIEAKVKNTEDVSQSSLNFIVEARLYDIDEDNKLANATSEAVSIIYRIRETFNLNLSIPEDAVSENDHRLYYKAYVKNKERYMCHSKSIAVYLQEAVCEDDDEDGYCKPHDCNDTNADVNPGADEICTDGIDNDCDGLIDEEDPDCDIPDDQIIVIATGKSDDAGALTTRGVQRIMHFASILNFKIATVSHSARVKNITSNSVTLTISSATFDISLATGQTEDVDTDMDGTEDLRITLNGIVNGAADITFRSIYTAPPGDGDGDGNGGGNGDEDGGIGIGWIIFIFVLVIGIAVVIALIFLRKKREGVGLRPRGPPGPTGFAPRRPAPPRPPPTARVRRPSPRPAPPRYSPPR